MTAHAIIDDGLVQLRADLLRSARHETANLGDALALARQCWDFVVTGTGAMPIPVPAMIPTPMAPIPAPLPVGEDRAPVTVRAPIRHRRADFHSQRWTPAEDVELEKLRAEGLRNAAIADRLGRDVGSVRNRLTRLRSGRREAANIAGGGSEPDVVAPPPEPDPILPPPEPEPNVEIAWHPDQTPPPAATRRSAAAPVRVRYQTSKRERRCITCQQFFLSDGPRNRLCWACRDGEGALIAEAVAAGRVTRVGDPTTPLDQAKRAIQQDGDSVTGEPGAWRVNGTAYDDAELIIRANRVLRRLKKPLIEGIAS